MSTMPFQVYKPKRPVPPCSSMGDLLKRCCEDWGLDYGRFRTGSIRPCVPCKGGTLQLTGVCPYCRGTGLSDHFMWRGYYASVMAEHQEAERVYHKLLDMHMNIKRKLTASERSYVRME